MPLVLYDAKCPLCNASIAFILETDTKKQFFFAPLGGVTANKYTKRQDSIVVIEGKRVFYAGKAALRIFWLLGGKYKLLGLFSFLPQFLSDLIYQWIAERRYSFFKGQAFVDPKDYPERFLP